MWIMVHICGSLANGVCMPHWLHLAVGWRAVEALYKYLYAYAHRIRLMSTTLRYIIHSVVNRRSDYRQAKKTSNSIASLIGSRPRHALHDKNLELPA